MTFIPKKASEWELFYPKKTASSAFAYNCALDWPATPTGYVDAASSTTTKFAGISQRVSTAADTDYASNTVIAALRPIVPRAQLIATTTGTAVATDVGGRFDLSDSVTVNRAAHAVGRVIMDEFHSATETVVHFLGPVETGAT